MTLAAFGWVLVILAGLGTIYIGAAAWVLSRFLNTRRIAPPRSEPVTLLKPLHGAEPCLVDNLASFLEQDHAGPVQLLLGVQQADDPAIDAVTALRARYPHARIDLVVDPARHGANGKVSNLINMVAHAEHDILVLSDSDMVVPRDYLSQVLAALETPGTGAVTCLYRGRGDVGFWSRIAAAGPSYQFLPNLVFAKQTGLASPCMGSTIALRRETLTAIGGFEAFANVLADDHAIGAAVERLGFTIAVPPMILSHASAERSLGDLWRQELRWATTIRAIALPGHLGSFLALPLPMAVVGTLLQPSTAALLVLTLSIRAMTVRLVDRHVGASTASLWTLPLRDTLSLGVFLASLFTRSVDWRGAKLNMAPRGRVVAASEFPET